MYFKFLSIPLLIGYSYFVSVRKIHNNISDSQEQ